MVGISSIYAFAVAALTFAVVVAEGQAWSSSQQNRPSNPRPTSNESRSPWRGRQGFSSKPWARLTNHGRGSVARTKALSSVEIVDTFYQETLAPPVEIRSLPVYDVIDGDLVLPSKRSLPPVDKELTCFDYPEQHDLVNTSNESSRKLELSLFATFMCNTFVLTLPVVMLPMIAAEQATIMGPTFVASAFAAAAASISMLGGGIGKVLNGFVCKWLGGKQSASLYLCTMAICSLLLSVNRSGPMMAVLLAAIEFCASIQWTAHLMLLANHYKGDPKRLSAGIATLSIGSTMGMLLAKIGGTAMLQYLPSWRNVAQLGTIVGLAGAVLVRALVPENPDAEPLATAQLTHQISAAKKSEKGLNPADLLKSLQRVFGSRLFWQAGLAHATAYLAHNSDKILGNFFRDVTALPQQVCGGLTVSVTLGFLHGLSKGYEFHALTDYKSKCSMLRKGYGLAVLSTAGMALCANKWLTSLLIPSQLALAGVVSLLAGAMASSLSFQVYQIPNMIATTFGDEHSVCLSFLDGLGFFLSAPIWALTGQIVSRLGDHGWSVALSLLAGLFGIGGLVMLNAFPTILSQQEQAVVAC